MFENNSLAPVIKAAGMEDYFDYKAYGRDEAINSYDIGDHGFVNKRISVDVEKYSYEEIKEMMKDQENDLDQGQTFSTFQNYEEQNVWEPEQENWSETSTYEQENYTMSGNESVIEEDIDLEITMGD